MASTEEKTENKKNEKKTKTKSVELNMNAWQA